LTGEGLIALKDLNCLSSLDLSYGCRITDTQFCDFIASCEDNKFVEVNLDNVNWLEDSSVGTVAKKNHLSLTYLNIDGENNTDEVFLAIIKCPNLKSLIVNFAQSLTDVALNIVQSCTQVFHEICFRKGHNFSNEGLMGLLSQCNFSQLVRLNLSECGNLGNSCAVMIAGSCPNLTHLSLCWCWEVNEVGVVAIVTCCSKMVEMDLTGLHKLTGESFVLVPEHMPNLEMLKLEMCNSIDDDIINCVVQKMKGKLSIINYYYEHIVYNPQFDVHISDAESDIDISVCTPLSSTST